MTTIDHDAYIAAAPEPFDPCCASCAPACRKL